MKKRLSYGFSLIELIIVISLFAITTILVTISYISFEGNQRLKNAALQIKSDLRQAQINAQSGDKGAGDCSAENSLAGWYMKASVSDSYYTIALDCLSGVSDENPFSLTTYNLPEGVTISNINNGADVPYASIFYKPLDYGASFHDSSATTNPPVGSNIDFFSETGSLQYLLGGTELVITLSSTDGTYKVKINSSGQVSESKT